MWPKHVVAVTEGGVRWRRNAGNILEHLYLQTPPVTYEDHVTESSHWAHRHVEAVLAGYLLITLCCFHPVYFKKKKPVPIRRSQPPSDIGPLCNFLLNSWLLPVSKAINWMTEWLPTRAPAATEEPRPIKGLTVFTGQNLSVAPAGLAFHNTQWWERDGLETHASRATAEMMLMLKGQSWKPALFIAFMSCDRLTRNPFRYYQYTGQKKSQNFWLGFSHFSILLTWQTRWNVGQNP